MEWEEKERDLFSLITTLSGDQLMSSVRV